MTNGYHGLLVWFNVACWKVGEGLIRDGTWRFTWNRPGINLIVHGYVLQYVAYLPDACQMHYIDTCIYMSAAYIQRFCASYLALSIVTWCHTPPPLGGISRYMDVCIGRYNLKGILGLCAQRVLPAPGSWRSKSESRLWNSIYITVQYINEA